MDKGIRIKLLREAKGITQEQLAEYLHTTKQTISKYEKNIVSNIPSDRIEELSKILDTTPSYILWGIDTKNNPLVEMPPYDPIIIEVIDMLGKLSDSEKKIILDLIRLFVNLHSSST